MSVYTVTNSGVSGTGTGRPPLDVTVPLTAIIASGNEGVLHSVGNAKAVQMLVVLTAIPATGSSPTLTVNLDVMEPGDSTPIATTSTTALAATGNATAVIRSELATSPAVVGAYVRVSWTLGGTISTGSFTGTAHIIGKA